MHIKRRAMPKFWPVEKTGTKYRAVPTHESGKAVPLIIIMRDLLKLVKSKKELKKILNEKKVLINKRIIKETNFPLLFFDSLSLPSLNKNYRVWINNGRLNLIEIDDKEAGMRVCRVIGKRKLSGGKVQINLENGENIISSEKIEVGDFVSINNEKKNIMKIMKMEKGIEAIVIKGKHSGKNGKIEEIVREGDEVVGVIKTDGKEIKANIKNIYATGGQ